MSFTLQVQFTGLCLIVAHADLENRPEAAVLLPDGRFTGRDREHDDGTPAVPHVGYLRVDLANVAVESTNARFPRGERPSAGTGVPDGPFFELVYRFGDLRRRLTGGQTLDFGLTPLAPGAPMRVNTHLPSFDDIAPNNPVRADLFTRTAGADVANKLPSPLLLRALLPGGEIVPARPGAGLDHWAIDPFLNARRTASIRGNFPSDVTWTRQVNDEVLTLSITTFDGTPTASLRLRPTGTRNKVLKLKIGNLCADNPLEWNEYKLREANLEDSDFKWFYTLLDPGAASWTERLQADALPIPTKSGAPVPPTQRPPTVPRLFPAPRLMTQPKIQPHATSTGMVDCSGSTATSPFRPFAQWSQP